MNIFSIRKKSTINRSMFLILGMLIFPLLFSGVLLFADSNGTDEHGKPLDVVLQEIRDKQGLGPDEAIDPRTVSDRDLEELGEAVMSIAHPDPRQHEFMDNMMGGEGSRRLARIHRRMGYNYLAGEYDYDDYMMDSGMMGRSRRDRGVRRGNRNDGSMMEGSGGMM